MMKNKLFTIFIALPILCFGQSWTIDAGDDFVFCDGDENIQLQGTITNPNNDSLTILWETEFTLGSSTFYADVFLDSVNALTPTLSSSITSAPELTFYLKVTDTLGNQQIDSVITSVSSYTSLFHDFYFHIQEGDSLTLLITAQGGLPPFTYEWMPNVNISDNTVRNPIVYPITSTNYSVTITDARGCVIPSNYCDVMEVYVTPLSLSEIKDSEIEWYLDDNHLIIKSDKLTGKEIVLYDICGKPIKTFISKQEVLNVNMSNLERGLYFLKIEENNVIKFTW
ncbi:MAG: T9SS type A sorting domain-containing protein [Flavobacteriales bacterium]